MPTISYFYGIIIVMYFRNILETKSIIRRISMQSRRILMPHF